jgi:hypothetical protein
LITDKIIKHVTTQKNINIDTRQRATWANAIRLLIEKDLAGENEDRIRRVEKAMDYVLENHTDQYCPVIESGTSFRKKFLKIENQMNKPLNIYQKQRPLSPYQQEMAIRDKLFKSLREENEQDSGYTETIEIGDSPKAII